MMKRFILSALAVWLMAMPVALPAFGSSLWGRCGAASVAAASAGTADMRIAGFELECFYFNADEDSPKFTVMATSALVCLDPDVTTEGSASASVMVRLCHTGSPPSANTCFALLNGNGLDGTTGGEGTQNACVRVGPGSYYIENTVSAATDEAIVSIQGEGD